MTALGEAIYVFLKKIHNIVLIDTILIEIDCVVVLGQSESIVFSAFVHNRFARFINQPQGVNCPQSDQGDS